MNTVSNGHNDEVIRCSTERRSLRVQIAMGTIMLLLGAAGLCVASTLLVASAARSLSELALVLRLLSAGLMLAYAIGAIYASWRWWACHTGTWTVSSSEVVTIDRCGQRRCLKWSEVTSAILTPTRVVLYGGSDSIQLCILDTGNQHMAAGEAISAAIPELLNMRVDRRLLSRRRLWRLLVALLLSAIGSMSICLWLAPDDWFGVGLDAITISVSLGVALAYVIIPVHVCRISRRRMDTRDQGFDRR
jgi:hypothetical protein